MRVVWSPLALDRVEDIAQYIAEDKPSAAVEWVNGVFDTVERLADFPESGRIVPEVDLCGLKGYVGSFARCGD